MLSIDPAILQEFEENLNTRYPERSKIPAKIIGFGEISTVFSIEHPLLKGLAFKRIAIFSKEEELKEYDTILKEYITILRDKIKIQVISTEGISIKTNDNRHVYYIVQPLLQKENICNQYFRNNTEEEVLNIFQKILLQLKRMYKWNQTNPNLLIGLDSQISNWAISTKKELVYLDISTPLYRKEHKEALKAEMFLRSTPFFLRFIIKKLFLQEVLDRYYDFRLIILDAIANLYKEKLENKIPLVLEFTNNFFKEQCKEDSIKEINIKEIQEYYKSDAFIWKFYLSSRKIDRWITTKIFKNRYEFLLPEKIER